MTTPPPVGPRQLGPADEAALKAVAAGGWVCRSCAHILKVRFTYAPSPWAYCLRCSGTLMPDEQLAAIGHLRLNVPEPRGEPQLHTADRSASAPGPVKKPLLPVAEVAAILCTTPGAIYAMHARRKLPGATKVGRRLLFRRDALLRWLAEGEPHR